MSCGGTSGFNEEWFFLIKTGEDLRIKRFEIAFSKR